jgi:glycosyltransferase involved in cell wall biosynthesis
MTSEPLVTIIIPTYNRANEVVTALDSVISQTYHNWECLVVDDQSNDNTVEIFKKYQSLDYRFQYFIRDREPKGAPTCRNIGLKHAKGDFIVFLDSDDYLLSFCLEQRVKRIKGNQHCDFLIFPMAEKHHNSISKREISNSEDYLIEFLSCNLPWSIMCPIWKTSFLLKLNAFTEGYPRFNDPELMIRALVSKEVTFRVFNEDDYDAVYVINPKENKTFNFKVYRSLILFIPDICKVLIKEGKEDYIKYLSNYLHLWFKYFYIPSDSSAFKPSFKLIWMFYRQGVISGLKAWRILLRFTVYVISKLITKTPINRLTPKSLYN